MPYLYALYSFFEKVVKKDVNVQIKMYPSDSISVIIIQLTYEKNLFNDERGIVVDEKVDINTAMSKGNINKFIKVKDFTNIHFGGTNYFINDSCITMIKENVAEVWSQKAVQEDVLRMMEK